MKKLGLILAGVLGAALPMIGCGDDDSGSVDAGKKFDAGVKSDGGKVDADTTHGTVEDLFFACTQDADCMNSDSECIQTPYFTDKVCLPNCDSTADCPIDSYCYKSATAELAAMKNHCGLSLCGEQLDPNNHSLGVTGGPCQLGAETLLPVVERLNGICFPIDDGILGQCIEAGSQTVGMPCDVAERTREGNLCDQDSLCISPQGAIIGSCAKICDPRTILTRAAGDNSGCPTGEDCKDNSSGLTLKDPMNRTVVLRQTLGFCTEETACMTVGANTCPADSAGVPQGCMTTNELRATGICSINGTGAVALGGTCSLVTPTTDAEECMSGSLCFGETGSGVCNAVCDIAPLGQTTGTDGGAAVALVTCETGKTCKSQLFSVGRDQLPDTEDDVFTIDWGFCE